MEVKTLFFHLHDVMKRVVVAKFYNTMHKQSIEIRLVHSAISASLCDI